MEKFQIEAVKKKHLEVLTEQKELICLLIF